MTVSTPSADRLALKGDLLDFTAQPAWGRVDDPAVRFRPDHWLLVEGGRIVGAQADDPGDGWQRVDHSGKLILPGFIDTHVHSPQLDVIASYGTELLDWLNTYTFPAEQRYADEAVARAGAARFLDALLAHGTTAAVVYPTVHKISAEALFDAAAARGMRLITGKVLMDRHAPDGLRDDVVQAERDCRELIERHHRRERLAYAVTVRFAPTSTPEQLAMAGRLCQQDPSLYMQTHVAENRSEVDWVARLFPQARSYLDVYDRVGLLHPRSVLAHGIWLDDEDHAVLARTGAHIAHCPSSNLFLGSGLFNWPKAQAAGVRISAASDVGGGTSLSTQRTLADGYKVQALNGQRLTAWAGLHAATRGAAEALGLSEELGHFGVDTLADVCIWDWAQGAVADTRMALARDLHEKVFAWVTLSDERNLVASYVAGRERHRRSR
ncbi:guanine deaminase [Roseateles sp. YR242]|uniref:guanine deaminase n=1 Tax=Roseateles sp. YR242 TaxID=1855305 RepID=UPI0008AB037A|nr:guanine deaminase [Roseateles sp. YR242]SEK54735.1 guanine deaminase [Roseateles sp. YR242]